MKSFNKPRLPVVLARLSVAAVVGIALVAASPVLAKNSKNNGKGNSAEHSNGNNGHSNGKSASKVTGEGASAHELGALNAAHASANALLHANPNSRVGRIAIFRDAVLETDAIQADRDAAQAILDGMTAPPRSSADVATAILEAEGDKFDLETMIGELEASKLVPGADIGAIDLEIGLLNDDLALVNGDLANLGDELTDALTYEGAEDDLAGFDEILADRPAIERALLEAAANKPVTDAVEAAVEELLGLN